MEICWFCDEPIRENQVAVKTESGLVHKNPCHQRIIEEECYFCDETGSPLVECKDCHAYEYAKEYFGEEVKVNA